MTDKADMPQSAAARPSPGVSTGTGIGWHDVRRGARFALVTGPLFLIWEIAQLPLYTIWWDRPLRESIAAAVHCTFGDIAVAFICFMLASVLTRFFNGASNALMFGGFVILMGVTATAILEVLSTQILNRWSYAPAMPTLPWLGIGLSPLLQWIVVPTIALLLLARLSKPHHGK